MGAKQGVSAVREDTKPFKTKGEVRREIRTYIEKTPEGIRFRRYNDAQIAVLIGGVGWWVLTVILNQPLNLVFTSALLTLCAFIWFDPFRLISRWLATPTRAMTSVLIMCWVVCINAKWLRLTIATAVATAVCLVLIILMNRRWHNTETYMRTMRGRLSGASLQPEDFEEIFRDVEGEVVAIASELGASLEGNPNSPEHDVRKACVSLGVRIGTGAMDLAAGDRDRAQSEWKALVEENIKLNQKLLDVYEIIKEQKKVPDLEARLDYAKSETYHWSTRCVKAEEKNEKLLEENISLGDQIAQMKAEIARLKSEVDVREMEVSAMADVTIVDEGPAFSINKVPTIEEQVIAFLCTKNPDTNKWYGFKTAASEFNLSVGEARGIWEKNKAHIEQVRLEGA